MDISIESALRDRVARHLPLLQRHLPGPRKLYIAGGCLTHEVNDIDVFPVDDTSFEGWNGFGGKTFESKNAKTFQWGGQVVQLCKYQRDSLESLVESFDFAHIKAGAFISWERSPEGLPLNEVVNLYISQDFVTANCLRSTWYTGSNYPLSSLLRANKYKARGLMNQRQYVENAVAILANIVNRGFRDYDDFKDQLDAIDLSVKLDEMDGATYNHLINIYRGLAKPC